MQSPVKPVFIHECLEKKAGFTVERGAVVTGSAVGLGVRGAAAVGTFFTPAGIVAQDGRLTTAFNMVRGELAEKLRNDVGN